MGRRHRRPTTGQGRLVNQPGLTPPPLFSLRSAGLSRPALCPPVPSNLTCSPLPPPPASAALREELDRRGYAVTTVQESDTFCRLLISRDDNEVLVDLGIDSPSPDPAHPDAARTDPAPFGARRTQTARPLRPSRSPRLRRRLPPRATLEHRRPHGAGPRPRSRPRPRCARPDAGHDEPIHRLRDPPARNEVPPRESLRARPDKPKAETEGPEPDPGHSGDPHVRTVAHPVNRPNINKNRGEKTSRNAVLSHGIRAGQRAFSGSDGHHRQTYVETQRVRGSSP